MFYLVYQITNQINGKIYIGVHKTDNVNDGYMGSGTVLKMAQTKYGIENFSKEIIAQFDNADDMMAMESQLVNSDFIKRKDTYNLKEGGSGGFDFINSNNLGVPNITPENASHLGSKAVQIREVKRIADPLWAKSYSKNMSKALKGQQRFLGKKHTEETLQQMRESHRGKHDGEKNSQFGSFWICNDVTRESIKTKGPIPDGWRRGRLMK